MLYALILKWSFLAKQLASYADALRARHAIFLPHEEGGRLCDEP